MLPDSQCWIKEGIVHDYWRHDEINDQFIDYVRQDQQRKITRMGILTSWLMEAVQARKYLKNDHNIN